MIHPIGSSQDKPESLIDLSSNDYFMGEAVRQARVAYDQGEVPIGSIIVMGNKIIARAHNQVELLKDPTAHAEILAITQATHAVGDWRLVGASLFVTKEPCPMCAGAIVLARIDHVVFGVADDRAGGAGTVFPILQSKGLNHTVQVTGGVKEKETRILLQSFFQEKRRKDACDGAAS